MEKRVFLFLIITFSFILSYSLWVKSITPNNSPQKRKVKKKRKEVYLPKKKGKMEDIETDKFIVTYSITGGYIKKIFIKPYKEYLPFTNIGYSPQYKDKEFKLIRKDDTVILIYDDLVKEFTFQDYLLKLKIKNRNYGKILFCNLLESNRLSRRYQEIFYQDEDKLKRNPFLRTKEGSFKTSFLGASSRYYCLVIWDKKTREVLLHRENKEIDWIVKTKPLEDELNIYIGPQLQEELKKYNLEKIIHYGTFHPIAILLIKILKFFNSFTHNWGVSIILLSAAVYLLFFPFTAKSAKAMKKMQEVQLKLQPKIEELKGKYKDNPTRLNKELVELYRQYGVNPAGGCLGGCLPLFLQLPFFIALYQVLLRLVELKNARFLWIKDLSSPDRAIFLGFNFPFIGEYLNVLPLLLVVLNLLQQRLAQSSLQDTQQKQMGTFFVLFIGIIFYHFPSGLVLYWLTQNIFTFIYQWRLNRVSFS